MKKSLFLLVIITTMILPLQGYATDSVDVKSIQNQLLNRSFNGSPSFLNKTTMIGELGDGTIVIAQDGSEYIFVNPTIINLRTMQIVQPAILIDGMGSALINPLTPIHPPIDTSVKKHASDTHVKPKVLGQKFNMNNNVAQKIITVFVDPLCPSCHKFMTELRYARLPKNIAFFIVPVDVISNDPLNQKAANVLSGDNNYMLSMLTKTYPKQPMDKFVKYALENKKAYFNIDFKGHSKVVPAFIMPDGSFVGDYRGINDLLKRIQ